MACSFEFQKSDKEIEFFNNYVRNFGQYNVFTEKGWKKILGFFNYSVQSRRKGIIVDLGCGTGSLSGYLVKQGFRPIGIDISSEAAKYAAKYLNGKSKFIIGDIQHIPLRDDSCGVVILGAVLHHFPDFSKLAEEIYRVLKKGGSLFSFDPNKFNPIMWLYRDKKSPFYSKVGQTVNERLITGNEIKNIFEKQGFTVETKGISGITFRFLHEQKMKKLMPVYNACEILLGKTFFSKWIGSFIITWGRK